MEILKGSVIFFHTSQYIQSLTDSFENENDHKKHFYSLRLGTGQNLPGT